MPRQMKDSGIEWIGEIPEDWEIERTRFSFNFRKGLSITKDDLVENGEAVISYGQIHSKKNTGVHIEQEFIRFVPVTYKDTDKNALCDDMDIIFADTSEDYEGIGNCIYNDYNGVLFAGYHTIIAHLKNDNISPKFCAYVFSTDGWRSCIRANAFGIKVYSVTQSLLKNTMLIVPPLDIQNLIVAFLDNKCSPIDSLIAKTQETIEEYKKLKQAVITQAVTKGVRGDRPMKGSGIEWIGEIPAEWEVTGIKNIFRLRDERNYKPLSEVNLISLYTEKGVIQHSDLEETTGNKASNADGYKIVYKGDIVVNIILCWMGAIGYSAFNGVTSPAYDVYIPNEKIESRFYHHYFRTTGFNGECYKRGRGIMAMRWRTYSDQFRDIKVVKPSRDEQIEILAYLDSKCAAIDNIITKKQQFITELESYKKSLIYEYVTGKKEVS